MKKLTEKETVQFLVGYLKQNGWNIDNVCLGSTHGNDIEASNPHSRIIIEVKGARAGDEAKTKKREKFDSSQIKTHFGVAIVKILNEKHNHPQSQVAIAHPDDPDIRRTIGHLIPSLETLEIKHFWVTLEGTVVEGY